ncbi:MAG: cupin domain-containing protein [Ramlibacter sp.]
MQVKEFLLAPGEELPWHHHTYVFVAFYCLEGTLTVQRCAVWIQYPWAMPLNREQRLRSSGAFSGPAGDAPRPLLPLG